ncbi:MAG: cysteine desulfurase NifS [Defluviitaleaceae bacterium]|nr:cysteine desulfurase NifS [Defluviitaleaceae bacterium]
MNPPKKVLYFDNAATTPLHPKVLEHMMPYLTEQYGNPSGVYSFAREVRKGIEHAREQVAEAIFARPGEIFFTSSGTEANNWVLKGVVETLQHKGGHIITTAIEHHAITHVSSALSKQGVEITYLPVDNEGFVSPSDLIAAIRPDTILISIMWANNEIGTIQPIPELSAIAKSRGVLFHTDAVQAVGHIPVNVENLPIDFLTMSAHKFSGPKGVGALYIRKGTKVNSILFGGAQEKNRRAGTENVAGIIGMGAALNLAVANLKEEQEKVTMLRDYLIERIETTIPKVALNGPRAENTRLPGNVNFSFDYIEGESLLLLLDMQGCCASSGSACSSASLEPSHVLLSLGISHEKAHGSIRFSLGRENTREEIDQLMEILPKQVKQLRAMSPLAEEAETSKAEYEL